MSKKENGAATATTSPELANSNPHTETGQQRTVAGPSSTSRAAEGPPEEVTAKINRTKFMKLMSYKAVEYFVLAVANMLKTTFFTDCTPKPEDLKVKTDNLESLMSIAKQNRNGGDSGNLANAIEDFKTDWKAVASFTETTYPGDKTIAGVINLEYNLTPSRNAAVPPQVTNAQVGPNGVPSQVLITHDRIGNFRGKLVYVLFISTDNGVTFREGNFALNAKGITLNTVRKQEYQLYVAARNTGGAYGPQSNIVGWVGQ